MCGIFGHFDPRGADPALVERMAQRLAHRGPDGCGTYHAGALAFGAGRLAIIDLAAPAGPIFNEDRRVGVVYNGEIYNFRDLRRTLEAAGHTFATRTGSVEARAPLERSPAGGAGAGAGAHAPQVGLYQKSAVKPPPSGVGI